MANIFKTKTVKSIIFCFAAILLLYFSFMIGRYSWLIEKPAFLLGPKEKFWIDKAREFVKKDGFSEKLLKKPSIKHAVLVNFKNDTGENTVEVTIEKMSGQLLRWSGNR